jgi:hypothetical protein
MTIFANRFFARLAAAAIAAACFVLAGCAAPGGSGADAGAATAYPSVAGDSGSQMTPALRCMDGLLLEHGVRDLSVIVEDLTDPTRKTQAGAKEMLLSALSDMTQRSRAMRLVASGADWNQTVNVMTQAGKRDAHALAPQFALRGALSRNDGGAAGLTLALDLTLLTTQDMSMVPGTATHNELRLQQGGAQFVKFGQPFNVASAQNPQAASRTLVEVAAIETLGKLTKVPYWTCLGLNSSNDAVNAEMQDWFDALMARPTELITYFQTQLRQRQAYDGPIDGTVNAPFKDAVARTREALGQPRESKLSLDFFKAYLAADSAALNGKLRASAPAPAAAPGAPLGLRVAALNDARRFARGEAVQLQIRPNRDAHVYCFLQDEKRQITRFFPNRFQRDSRVPDAGLQLPGPMRFKLLMNPQGVTETVTCFATERDVLPELPAALNAGDFNPLPVASLDQVRSAFVKASGGTLAHESFELRAK